MRLRFPSLLCVLLSVACGGGEEAERPVAETCPDGELIDGDACVPEECGTGTWGKLETLAPTIYVQATAEEGGDGSQQAPFSAISDALDAASDAGGGVVAVAAGSYAETPTLGPGHDGVVLAGRCAALVSVEGGDEAVTLSLNGRTAGMSATVSGLTISGAARGGVLLASGQFSLRGLVIADNAGRGLDVSEAGTLATVDDLTIVRTVGDADGTSFALVVWEDAALQATGLRFEENQRISLLGIGSEISVEGLSITGTQEVEGESGSGLWLEQGAVATISDSVWSDNSPAAIKVRSGSSLSLVDAEIEGVSVPDDDLVASGVAVSEASADLLRVNIADVQPYGLYLDEGSEMSVDQVSVSETQPTTEIQGSAVGVYQGSTLQGTDLCVAGSVYTGVYAEESTLVLDGLTVSGVVTGAGGLGASGVYLNASTAELGHLDVSAVQGSGLGVDLGSQATVADALLHDMPARARGGAIGVDVSRDSVLVASELTISDVGGGGLFVYEGSRVTLDAVSILRIANYDGTSGGVGLASCIALETGEAPTPCTVEARDLLVSDTTAAGIFLVYTEATLSDVEVATTHPISDGTFGYGIIVERGATLEGEDLRVSEVYGIGLGVFDGSATLDGVSIAGVYHAPESQTATGLSAQSGAQILASNVTVEDIEGPGLVSVGLHSSLTCSGCSVQHAEFAGAFLQDGASLSLDGDSDILDTAASPGLGGGVGLMATGYSALFGFPTLFVDELRVEGSPLAGIYLDGPGTYEIQNSDIEGGQDSSGPEVHPWGDGIFATVEAGDEQAILLTDNTLHDAAGAGLFLDGTTAILDGNAWEDNNLDVVQQGCAETDPPEGEEPTASWELCPIYDHQVERLAYYIYLTPLDFEGE